jgi:hypothetical protein
MPPVRLFARKVKNALTDKDSAARWPLACGASQRFFNQSGGWSISAWHRPGGGLTVLRSGQEHDAEKHVLGLDPRMDPHPGQARVQAFRINIMLSFLESIMFMRFN